jgi:hypothetical protein
MAVSTEPAYRKATLQSTNFVSVSCVPLKLLICIPFAIIRRLPIDKRRKGSRPMPALMSGCSFKATIGYYLSSESRIVPTRYVVAHSIGRRVGHRNKRAAFCEFLRVSSCIGSFTRYITRKYYASVANQRGLAIARSLGPSHAVQWYA